MPGENIYSWSVTAADNGTADTSINFAEGQPRASVNNSARGMMAALAKQRNLITGAISTGGTTNVLTFTSGVGHTSLPSKMRVLLGISATNTGATTLNMDGIGAIPVVTKAGSALTGGELVVGQYVEFLYNGVNWVIIEDLSSDKVRKSGDTMTGALVVNSDIACGNLTAASQVTANNGLNVLAGGAGIAGNVSVTGSLTATGVFASSSFGLFDNATTERNLLFNAPGVARLTWQYGTGNLQFWDYNGVLAMEARTGGVFVIGNANAFKPGGGAWSDTSDARIKDVVGDYDSSLAQIKQLQPVRYTFKGNDNLIARDSAKEFIGLVAQAVEPHMPELVTRSNGKIDGAEVNDLRILDTAPLVYALVNSIKELLARIEALEAK